MKAYKALVTTIFIASIVLLSGCAATPTDPAVMAPVDYEVANKHAHSVFVATGGGEETNAMGMSKVSNADLAAAIEKTIIETRIFEQLVTDGSGDYKLSAYIITLDQPTFGMSFTVKTSIAWRLINTADNSVVWEEVLASQHTTGAGEAFAGVKRLRMATEGAVKANISAALAKLEMLTL